MCGCILCAGVPSYFLEVMSFTSTSLWFNNILRSSPPVYPLAPNIADNVNPYKISSHRHVSEIQQELHGFEDVKVSFTPHLVPVIRGIQTTSHSFLKEEHSDITPDELRKFYEKTYGKEYFIKLMDDGEIPHLSSVRGSNFVHIGGFEIDDTGRIVMLSCIDNLVRGASGQAIQNMNIMLGLDETTGLNHFGLNP